MLCIRLLALAACLTAIGSVSASGVDYSKRAQALDATVRARLLGKWTNAEDHLVIEFTSVDLASGELRGKLWPKTGPAAGNEHDVVGWVSAGQHRDDLDSVTPVSFSSTLHEYGTLPVWAGFLRNDTLVTMHYLVWPNTSYSWNHISTFEQTWTRVP